MDIDSPPSSGGSSSSSSSSSSSLSSSSSSPQPLSPRDRILQRLAVFGVPDHYLEDLQPGLVCFIKSNKSLLQEIVSMIVPTDVDIATAVNEVKTGSKKALVRLNLRDQYSESILWLKWLMFEGDPVTALKNLSNLSVGQRGVCGAVWGRNDLAFRCRTCEHDPTCAICVPCFQNGNHTNHDYSIIYTGGGCCDCGDETAWKREGFCSKHKGAEQIQPLPDEIASTVGPVLEALFRSWKHRLTIAGTPSKGHLSVSDRVIEPRKIAYEFSFVVVDMLLDFCECSESLLSFVSKRLIAIVDLLNLLVRAERFLSSESIDVTNKLHELLLKLLAEPEFKYEFAKVFVNYYPFPVAEVLKASDDKVLEKYPLLSMFAVQVFTVPSLTSRLVRDWNLLAVLLGCLCDILLFCCGEEGKFQFNKWVSVFNACIRVMEDVRFVLSHSDVAEYVTHERSDIVKAWVQILSVLQGMNPQRRETGIHIEEDIENVNLPFIMLDTIANIHVLLVNAAFSVAGSDEMDQKSLFQTSEEADEGFSQRQAKVGRTSVESSVCSSSVHSSASNAGGMKCDGDLDLIVLPSVLKLTSESLKAIDCWLAGSNVFAADTRGVSAGNLLSLKEALPVVRKGKYISHPSDGSGEMSDCSYLKATGIPFSSSDGGHTLTCPMNSGDMPSDCIMEIEAPTCKDGLSLLSLSEWPEIEYDVSLQEISLHIPLHGFLALILKEALRYYFGESVTKDKRSCSTPSFLSDSGNFFESLLVGCHPYGFSSFVMEHPLQSRVFCSQFRAGMWRRNGDAATICYEWYRAIRWSDHELELDLFLLQLCAAFAPADNFVQRLLQRFQLSNYMFLDLKRSSEYEPVLMQELLTLIIQIIQERRFCGLTASENLHRELICKLASGDATHSQLVKSLPRDLSKSHLLQEVLDKISQYSNPSGMNQGKYSLRLPYWKQLDLYHPCWNPRDLQVAEERYSRFCGVSALSSQLPRWKDIYEPLVGLARIATCKTVLLVIQAVVYYAVSTHRSNESRAPDGVLITALHLLSLALDICLLERKSFLSAHNGDYIPMLAIVSEGIGLEKQTEPSQENLLSLLVLLMRIHKKETSAFTEGGDFNLSSLVEILLRKFAEVDSKCHIRLQQLAPETFGYQSAETISLSSATDMEKRKTKARERQAVILAKMRDEQSKFLATLKSTEETTSDESFVGFEEQNSDVAQDSEENHVCCLCHDPSSSDPLSFLCLLQKSRLVQLLDKGPPSWESVWQSDVSESSHSAVATRLARNTNAFSLENLSPAQLVQIVNGAMSEFASYAHPAELTSVISYFKMHFPELESPRIPQKSSEKKDKMAYSPESLELDIFLSVHKEICSAAPDSDLIEKGISIPSIEDGVILMGKYIASFSHESKDSSENSGALRVKSAGQFPSYEGYGPSDCDGIHISSCGHVVHQGCLDRYLSSLKERNIRRMIFDGGNFVDPNQGEFLCPVCRRLANSTLPTVPVDPCELREQSIDASGAPGCSFGFSSPVVDETASLQLQHGLSALHLTASVASRGEMLKALPMHRNEQIHANFEPVFKSLWEMYFPGEQDVHARSSRVSLSVLMWDTLKYSLVSTEIAARSGKSCLASRRGLSSLFSEFQSSGEFMLPLLLRIIQRVRTSNLPDLLLRFIGLQHFAASICSGFSYGKCRSEAVGEKGLAGQVLSIFKCRNSEVFPDVQFWDRASDPVLICDPFSTLMWILFCLPFPFLSSKECLISLIHILYGVSVSQAIITFSSQSECNLNNFGFHDDLVSDITSLAGGNMATKQYFCSKYLEPSCAIKDAIENLSLPFLRRCSLLWRVLNSSSRSPFPPMGDALDKSLHYSAGQARSTDIDEISELRSMFRIPPLDIVFKDVNLRCMAKKWFHHLMVESENQVFQHALYTTPCVPFQLMCLPSLYQDLVQRYIKPQCRNCNAVQDDAALCLLCGSLCSPAWKPCCRENGCQAHSLSCGAGTGVFLQIRKTTILLQRNARQALWPSPYLDAFGEEDHDMRRGRPLFLNEERYAALTYMVASHGLDRSSKYLRQTPIGTFFMV